MIISTARYMTKKPMTVSTPDSGGRYVLMPLCDMWTNAYAVPGKRTNRTNRRFGKKISQVPRKAMEALQRHPWPGKVRQLRNVIEHAAIVTTGDTLKVPGLDDTSPLAPSLQTLADAERSHILKTLETTGWRVGGPKGAAAMLGLNASTLRSRMKKLGIRSRWQDDTNRT